MGVETGGEAFWYRHVEQWRGSGQTQRAYCREQGLPEGKFSHWKQRWSRDRRQGHQRAQLVPVSVIEETAPGRVGTKTREQQEIGCRDDLTLVFTSGLRLEIGRDVESGTLRRVLEVLGDVG